MNNKKLVRPWGRTTVYHPLKLLAFSKAWRVDNLSFLPPRSKILSLKSPGQNKWISTIFWLKIWIQKVVKDAYVVINARMYRIFIELTPISVTDVSYGGCNFVECNVMFMSGCCFCSVLFAISAINLTSFLRRQIFLNLLGVGLPKTWHYFADHMTKSGVENVCNVHYRTALFLDRYFPFKVNVINSLERRWRQCFRWNFCDVLLLPSCRGVRWNSCRPSPSMKS